MYVAVYVFIQHMSVSGEYKHFASETEARDMHPQTQNRDFLENFKQL
jgi:hypothetical protein